MGLYLLLELCVILVLDINLWSDMKFMHGPRKRQNPWRFESLLRRDMGFNAGNLPEEDR